MFTHKNSDLQILLLQTYKKHDLLKEILAITAQNLKHQRLYLFYKQQLTLTSNVSSKSSILNLTAPHQSRIPDSLAQKLTNPLNSVSSTESSKTKELNEETDNSKKADSISTDINMEGNQKKGIYFFEAYIYFSSTQYFNMRRKNFYKNT